MRVLSIQHGPLVRAEVFGDATRDAGHELDEWQIADGGEPPQPVEEYDAVFVFGGHMNVDDEREHPWLVDEDTLLRRLVEHRTPLLGVCLGGQLLAKAMGADVGPSPEPERGFVRVELTDAAADDAVFGSLPREFDAFQLHNYAFDVPPGAAELARSRVCAQAFRVGESAWGLQFHPEVRVEQVERWLSQEDRDVPEAERVLAEARERFGWWNGFGAELCRSFLAAAAHRTGARAVGVRRD